MRFSDRGSGALGLGPLFSHEFGSLTPLVNDRQGVELMTKPKHVGSQPASSSAWDRLGCDLKLQESPEIGKPEKKTFNAGSSLGSF